ncbi:Bifunctional DNA primase/polymerase, N-terminal [Devosia enhydra]|uniref:Bifunctional DNA primase/polymerase, N-terminal n=1 Tax=Devosia enhydra TaxID=665118 RepID=A0A1K2HVS9_9HYPH|nr:DUF5906 domain-containing protein [Devosia enhydra]SFZ82902.1 Bifunctional DNA primase/polymerase, N-terminal [Devosia enhydra]
MAKGIKSAPEVMETLDWAMRHGFKPVALHAASKSAISGGFEKPDYLPPGEDFWRKGDFGIGMALGPSHGGLIDVDLDTNSAVFFAEKFFPPTDAVFGRNGKPRSHRLYRVPTDIVFRHLKALDPIRDETVIELRGDGHQTVFPGSIHEGTGEVIAWSEGGQPEVAPDQVDRLVKAFRMTVVAALISEHLWGSGVRNNHLLPLTGLLMHRGWAQEDVEAVIAAVMEREGDSETSRLRTIRLTFARDQKGVATAGAGKLRKLVGNSLVPVVEAIVKWASDNEDFITDYNDRFAAVNMKGSFRIVDLDPPQADAPWSYMTKDAFFDMRATDFYESKDETGKVTRKNKARSWFISPRRREYDALDFVPGGDVPRVLNMWRGWAEEPSTAGSCDAWLELLRDVICGGDEEVYRWHLNWFAQMLREPGKKPRTAPVWIGRQGAGKSLAVEYVGRILGRHYMEVSDARHVTGHFNAHLADILLLHSAEALWPGDKEHRPVIKRLITDPTHTIEPKGVNAYQVRNHLRLIMTSNYDRAALAERDDRRHTTVHLGERKASSELIARVVHELENGGPARLHQYLAHELEYDATIPVINLKNKDLLDLKLEELDPVRDWWLETLMGGQLLPEDLGWAQSPKLDDEKAGAARFWPAAVSTQALLVSLQIALRQRNIRFVPPMQKMLKQLRQYLGIGDFDYTQLRMDNPQLPETQRPEVRGMSSRPRVITNFPSLAEARRGFEQYMGHSMVWHEVDGEDQHLPEASTVSELAEIIPMEGAQARQREKNRREQVANKMSGGKF